MSEDSKEALWDIVRDKFNEAFPDDSVFIIRTKKGAGNIQTYQFGKAIETSELVGKLEITKALLIDQCFRRPD